MIFEKIYTLVSLIPKGKVTTYKQVASLAGLKNQQIVGYALHANKHPGKVPCHRVVNIQGLLAKGYAFGGVIKQRMLLRNEGVFFLDMTTVDLSKSLYQWDKEKPKKRSKAY